MKRIIFIACLLFCVFSSTNGEAQNAKSVEIKGGFSTEQSVYKKVEKIVIRDSEKWDAFCKDNNLENKPNVDFAIDEVLIVTGGECTSTGYEVKIHSVDAFGKKLKVSYTINAPIDGEKISPISSTPLTGVVITKSGLEAEFNDIAKYVPELLAQLADDDWEKRENATKKLVRMGKIVVPEALKILNTSDAEVKMRLRYILSEIVPSFLIQQTGWLGIYMNQLEINAPAVTEHIKEGCGIMVSSLIPDQPAEKYGIKANDIIIALNDKGFESINDWAETLKSTSPGTRVNLTLVREGKKQEIAVVIGNRPKEKQDPEMVNGLWNDWWNKHTEIKK
ncbi:MAG: PDZ domain-containing protein [Planctomycetes bacterium]|nr:PDZ domain-containing protein [Planctomycetota bacterium]